MHIQIIIGSIREGRRGRAIGEWARRVAAARQDMTVELIDLKDWNFPVFSLAKPPAMGEYEDPDRTEHGAAGQRASSLQCAQEI